MRYKMQLPSTMKSTTIITALCLIMELRNMSRDEAGGREVAVVLIW
jgi:hypothetical protein